MKDDAFRTTEFKFISALIASVLLRTHANNVLRTKMLLQESLEERAEEFL